MKILIVILLFLISCMDLKAIQKEKYELAICAITRDDAPYLKEWVDFHLHQGVEHIYIYDNLSEDHPEIVLKEYIRQGVVEIINWNVDHKTRKEWGACQIGAFMDCVKKKKNEVVWCAFIDTDEFLFCPTGQKLPAFLKQFVLYDQVAVNWLIFGTSNVPKATPGKLIQELLMRTETNRANDCKSVVRLKQVTGCHSPHFFLIKNMDLLVNPNKKVIKPAQFNKSLPCIDKIRIHHYMFRDLDFFQNTKLARLKQQARDPGHIIEYEKTSNKVRDDFILKCLPNN